MAAVKKTPPSLETISSYMNDLKKFTLLDWLQQITEPRGEIIRTIYARYADLLHTNPASEHNHQTWPGGLADHLATMCMFAWHDDLLYRRLTTLPYSFDSIIIAIFCHDAEKFVLSGPQDDERCYSYLQMYDSFLRDEAIKWRLLKHWERDFELALTADEQNAIQSTYGRGTGYSSDKWVMSPLGVAVGNAKRASTRVFSDYGQGLGGQTA